MKKVIILLLVPLLAVVVLAVAVVPASASNNLMADLSVEVNSNSLLTAWSNSKQGGTNITTFSYLGTGHTGSPGLNIKNSGVGVVTVH